MSSTENQCPCCSGSSYDQCCEPIIAGKRQPKTAEELMRARYSAFAKVDMDFVEKTHDPKTIGEIDMEGNRQWAQGAKWNQLEVLSTEQGGELDTSGEVEFRAHYTTKKGTQIHHELAEFTKRDGRWYFTDGKQPDMETFTRTEEKVGRNDPCPCGSGKKHKKCCGILAQTGSV